MSKKGIAKAPGVSDVFKDKPEQTESGPVADGVPMPKSRKKDKAKPRMIYWRDAEWAELKSFAEKTDASMTEVLRCAFSFYREAYEKISEDG